MTPTPTNMKPGTQVWMLTSLHRAKDGQYAGEYVVRGEIKAAQSDPQGGASLTFCDVQVISPSGEFKEALGDETSERLSIPSNHLIPQTDEAQRRYQTVEGQMKSGDLTQGQGFERIAGRVPVTS